MSVRYIVLNITWYALLVQKIVAYAEGFRLNREGVFGEKSRGIGFLI